MPSNQSDMFHKNLIILKIVGIWPGNSPSKYYRYYSFIYLFVTFVIYNFLLTLNLLYMPRNIELLHGEALFYFPEIIIASKILTVIVMRHKLIEAIKLIDCDEFVGDFDKKDGILRKTNMGYRLVYKLYTITLNIAFICVIFVPLLTNLIRGAKSELPICKYYFLSDDVRESYFFLWFIYQSVGMYGHMLYTVNIDLFSTGLLVIAVVQLKLLNSKLSGLKISEEETKLPIEIQDEMQMARLKKLLHHYEVILYYCETVQTMLSTTLFFQFGVGSITICLAMYGLLLPSSTEMRVFFVICFGTMTLQIFVPAFLGAQLSYESQELVTAAYNSEWIPRSESFKRTLKLFRERAAIPIVISGLKMFPLSVEMFISILRTAYSFFTLMRNVQEQ